MESELTESRDHGSVRSSIYRGIIQHGRRYQSLREGSYYAPADAAQFEAQNTGYQVQLVLDSQAPNPFFRAPLGDNAGNVLDIGCGDGAWAIDVADQFPNLAVHGVDLYPPPQVWMPPNCTFDVDDVNQEWTWSTRWDLIHMRSLFGCFADYQWDALYEQAYQ